MCTKRFLTRRDVEMRLLKQRIEGGGRRRLKREKKNRKRGKGEGRERDRTKKNNGVNRQRGTEREREGGGGGSGWKHRNGGCVARIVASFCRERTEHDTL